MCLKSCVIPKCKVICTAIFNSFGSIGREKREIFNKCCHLIPSDIVQCFDRNVPFCPQNNNGTSFLLYRRRRRLPQNIFDNRHKSKCHTQMNFLFAHLTLPHPSTKTHFWFIRKTLSQNVTQTKTNTKQHAHRKLCITHSWIQTLNILLK